MKAKIKSLALKEFEVKSGDNKGRKFKKFVFTADVVVDEERGVIRTLKGSMGEEYGRKYFRHCGYKTTSDVVGRDADVVLQKRLWTSDGEERTITEIKYCNMLDDDGQPIRLPKDDESDEF